MEPNGRTVYLSLNFLTTIAIKLVCIWHPLKPYIDESATPLSTGPRLEKAKCLDLIFSVKPKSKSN
jgi:hypothetical protein